MQELFQRFKDIGAAIALGWRTLMHEFGIGDED